jgi:hypothetical protein
MSIKPVSLSLVQGQDSMRRVEQNFAQALAGPHADQETISRPHFYKDVRKTLQHLRMYHSHAMAAVAGR